MTRPSRTIAARAASSGSSISSTVLPIFNYNKFNQWLQKKKIQQMKKDYLTFSKMNSTTVLTNWHWKQPIPMKYFNDVNITNNMLFALR